MARSVAPPSYLRRRSSRIRRIDTLSAGIGSLARHGHDEHRALPPQRSSDRHPKGGRLQIGMAKIKSEAVADLPRNQQGSTPRQLVLRATIRLNSMSSRDQSRGAVSVAVALAYGGAELLAALTHDRRRRFSE